MYAHNVNGGGSVICEDKVFRMALQENPESPNRGPRVRGPPLFIWLCSTRERSLKHAMSFFGDRQACSSRTLSPPLCFCVMPSAWPRPMAWERQYFIIINFTGLKRSGYHRSADSHRSSLPPASCLTGLRRAPHAPSIM